jgi:hypothetical protein
MAEIKIEDLDYENSMTDLHEKENGNIKGGFGIAKFGIAEFGIAEFGIAEFGIAEFGIAEFGIAKLSSGFLL